MSEKNKIIIHLKGAATARKYEEDELFQRDKFEEISHILDVMSKEIDGKDCEKIEECRNHDTIFVDGERGAGKTAFLLNIEDYIKNKNKEIYKKLKFFRPVDPTLLEDTENFLSVIVARILEAIYEEFSKIDKGKKEKFYSALNELGRAIGAVKERKDEVGIDEIASYASSIKIEEKAHEFFKIVAEILGVKKLVILIDDVDMAFDKGYEVLEVIRKYLASPYVVPIIAGDYELYREVIRNYFRKKFTYYKEEYNEKLANRINNLTEQYLQKVFPMEFRIELKDIKSIIENSEIKVKIEDEELDFKDVTDFDRNTINLGINRKEEQFDTIEYNTRKITKYLYRKKDIIKKFKEQIKEKSTPDINELKSSYEATAEFYKHAESEEKRLLAELVENDVKAFKDKKYDVYKAFSGLKIDNFENTVKSKRVYKNELKKINQKENIKKYKEILLLFLNEMFINKHQTSTFVFPEKFIRTIFFSLTNFDLDIKFFKEKEKNLSINGDDWSEILIDILKKENFLETLNEIENLKESVDFKNIKKEFEKIFYEKLTFIGENENDINLDNLLFEIIAWNYYFLDVVKINAVAMYKILKRFFENWNALEDIDDKYLIDVLQRMVLIFINSVAYYENKDNKISADYFGVNENWNLKNVFKNTPASFLNIKPLIIGEKSSFTKALFFHPIIKTILILDDNQIDIEVVKSRALYEKELDEFLKKNGYKSRMTEEEKLKLINKFLEKYETNKDMLKLFKEKCKTCFKNIKNDKLKQIIEKFNNALKEN